MKTIEISAFGISNLKLNEQPKPREADDEVLVKIDAVSLNYVDLLVVKGLLNPNLLPYIPGVLMRLHCYINKPQSKVWKLVQPMILRRC